MKKPMAYWSLPLRSGAWGSRLPKLHGWRTCARHVGGRHLHRQSTEQEIIPVRLQEQFKQDRKYNHLHRVCQVRSSCEPHSAKAKKLPLATIPFEESSISANRLGEALLAVSASPLAAMPSEFKKVSLAILPEEPSAPGAAEPCERKGYALGGVTLCRAARG